MKLKVGFLTSAVVAAVTTTASLVTAPINDDAVVAAATGATAASSSEQQQQEQDEINFLAIGDWGGIGSHMLELFSIIHPIHQRTVASGMAKVALRQKPEFIIGLGDNFYMTGLSSDDHAAYQRIEETFENVYNAKSLAGIPWYVCAGNHDHYGNVTKQIQYTNYSKNRQQQQTDSNHTHRWEFPSLYYKRRIQKRNLTLDVVMIDTIVLENAFLNVDNDSYWFNKIPFVGRDRQEQQQQKQQDGKQHWKWLETTLQESSSTTQAADYILVGGHYPVFNQGSHGPTQTLIDHLKPLLEQYQAHYIAGHDHAMMHFQTSQSQSSQSSQLPKAQSNLGENNSGVNYIVTGVGNSCCSYRRSKHQKKHEKEYPNVPLKWHLFHQDNAWGKVKGGFVSLRATKHALTIHYHDQDGKVLYQADPIVPRRINNNKIPTRTNQQKHEHNNNNNSRYHREKENQEEGKDHHRSSSGGEIKREVE